MNNRLARFVRLGALTCALAGALAGTASAQEMVDTFDKDTNTTPPGWSAREGTWKVSNGQLVTDQAAKWAYLTKDGLKPTDFVIDIDATYTWSGLQFAGVTGRFTSKTNNVTCKIQESDVKDKNFERSYIYENPNSSGSTWVFRYLAQPVLGTCTVRMVVSGSQVSMHLDFDNDGLFDQTITKSTKILGAGLVGLTIWGISAIDNFEFFNAVLQPAPAATPKIGTTYNMDLVTTARKVTSWRMAMSLGNKGFPFGRRRIPLDADGVFDLSLLSSGALGLSGQTGANGVAHPALKIPSVSSLVGVTMFLSAITLDGSRPDGIDNISNELGIVFVK